MSKIEEYQQIKNVMEKLIKEEMNKIPFTEVVKQHIPEIHKKDAVVTDFSSDCARIFFPIRSSREDDTTCGVLKQLFDSLNKIGHLSHVFSDRKGIYIIWSKKNAI